MARLHARTSSPRLPATLAGIDRWPVGAQPLQRAARDLKAQPLRPAKVVMILLVWALATAAGPLAG